MPDEIPAPGGPGGAGLGGVAARLEGMLEDRLKGLPTGRNTNKSWKGKVWNMKKSRLFFATNSSHVHFELREYKKLILLFDVTVLCATIVCATLVTADTCRT